MPLLARKSDATPGVLAAELTDARQRYEEVRISVVSRASERVASIAAIQADLDAERAELEAVKADAS